jgi:lipopolysaccharide export system ATP-binding protein
MSELVVQNLRKKYKNRTVVQDISLSIKSGEIVGLLGPNGAGKTTSFYMIVGLVPLDDGRIILDNKDISRLPIHQRAHMGLSYLPQEPSIFRKLTAADNIRAILELQDLSEDALEKRLEELLEELHITHIAWRPTQVLFC